MALSTNLVAYWKLDESSGNASDSVGSNTLTNGSVTYAAGKINNGATFTTGLTSSTSPVSGTGAWSISMWYKSSTTGTNKQLLLFGNSAQTAKTVIYLYTTTGNAIQLDTAGAGLITSSNTSSLNGNYHHLVVTYDGANNFAMYIDNASVGTGSTTSMNLGSNSMSIGYDNLNSRFAWGAQLDEVGFWNVKLTADEISQLFNSGRANAYPLTDTPSLYGGIAYYKLDESSGNASDSIGSATLTNANVTYSTGKINNGAVFGASIDDRLYTTTYSPFNFGVSDPFSFSLWEDRDTSGSSNNVFFSHKNYGGTWVGYILMANTDGTIQFSLTNTSTAGFTVTAPDLELTSWHHIVVTYDGSGSYTGVKIYYDGTSQTLTNSGTTVTGTITNSENFEIGAWTNAEDRFAGKMDEIGVWSRALTSTEVTSLYNGGSGLAYPFITGSSIFPRKALLGAGR